MKEIHAFAVLTALFGLGLALTWNHALTTSTDATFIHDPMAVIIASPVWAAVSTVVFIGWCVFAYRAFNAGLQGGAPA